MSYILSALKKSTEQRKRGEVPSISTWVDTQDTNITVEEGRSSHIKKKLLKLTLVGAMFVLILTGIFFLPLDIDKFIAEQKTQMPKATVGQATESSMQPVAQPPVAVPQPPLQKTFQKNQGVGSLPMPAMPNQPDDESIPSQVLEYNQLSPEFQNSLPPIQMNGHFYSETKPRLRKVIINDKVVRENQYLSQDIIVREIFNSGVVLEYRGQAFRLYVDQIFNQ
ncbi:MAG: general secretion pathway protein GspB [Candidatus Oxydemutatoraceae bacterium WSBS_2016_MAG_OTU14]